MTGKNTSAAKTTTAVVKEAPKQAPQQEAGEQTYIVLTPLKIAGPKDTFTRAEAGSSVTMDSDEAKTLLDIGAIRLADSAE